MTGGSLRPAEPPTLNLQLVGYGQTSVAVRSPFAYRQPVNLYLLRHGLAVEPGTPGFERDADRPLIPKGERKIEKIAEAFGALELSFDLILSSPYVRARQTAELVAKTLNLRKKLELSETLTPSGSARKLIDWLNHLQFQDVLLVGHEPFLSELISLLTAGQPGAIHVVMKKGGFCKLSAESLRPDRCAALEWLLTPKQMSLMS